MTARVDGQAVVRLRAVFERSRHPMLIVDDQRRGVTGNGAARELLQIAPEEVPWHTMDDFTAPSERRRLSVLWGSFLTSGAAEGGYELQVPKRGAVSVEFSATANVMPERHLLLFIAHDTATTGHAEGALPPEPAWNPVAAEGGRRLRLTEREREVMTLVASGLHTGEIAGRLFLSPETVKSHVHNAMIKLGSRTRAHAVAIALVMGEITWPGMPSLTRAGDQPSSA